MTHLLHLVGDIAVWVAFVASIAFCAMYAVVAPWRRSAEGWHLMTFTAVMAWAFGWVAYRQSTVASRPVPVSTNVARAVILGALAGLLVWRLALLIRAQIPRRNPTMSLPDEPIPQPSPAGATDAGLDGVDVTDEYVDEHGRMAAASSTWASVLTYARSYLGTYPPGRKRENVNDFTIEYYGTSSVAAAWCLIFVWHVLKHFGLAAWKLAYVPWLDRIPGQHDGHTGIKVGAICAISGFSHVGFFIADHGDTFDLLSGNSTSGSSSDAITVKRYSKSVISGYVNVDYGTTPAPPPPASGDDVVAVVIV